MAQEGQTENVELTDEQRATLTHGRVADLDAAVKNAAKAADDDKTAKDQAAIDAENEAKAKAEEEAKSKEEGKQEEEEQDDDSWKQEYVQLDNPHADAAIELLKESGVTPVEANAIFKDAIDTGDLNKVQWDVLESRLGKAKTALIRTGVEQYYHTAYQEQKEAVDYAYEQVGGEDGWKKVQAWSQSKEKADPNWAKAVGGYRKALEIGGAVGKAAIDAIKRQYEADPKNSSLNNKVVRGNNMPNASSDVTPISRVEYFRKYEEAGGDRAPDHIKKGLWAQRQAGIKSGM